MIEIIIVLGVMLVLALTHAIAYYTGKCVGRAEKLVEKVQNIDSIFGRGDE